MCKTKWKKCIINHTDCQLNITNDIIISVVIFKGVLWYLDTYIQIWACKYFHCDGLFNYMEMVFQIEFHSISN